jgi:hypothetical protein
MGHLIGWDRPARAVAPPGGYEPLLAWDLHLVRGEGRHFVTGATRTSGLRTAGVLLSASLFLLPATLVAATHVRVQEPEVHSTPDPASSAHPIADSVERAVVKVLEAHRKPCEQAEQRGLPCFPTVVEGTSDRISVAESIRRYRPDGSPSPSRPPTVAEMAPHMSGAPQSAVGGVNLGDPVCAVKSLWKKLRGTGGPYFLYRTWDDRGERPLLTDRPVDPENYLSNPHFRYEFLGEFQTECKAIAAWRSALRDAVARDEEAAEEGDEASPGSAEVPAADPPP